jgi:hypothetical protein
MSDMRRGSIMQTPQCRRVTGLTAVVAMHRRAFPATCFTHAVRSAAILSMVDDNDAIGGRFGGMTSGTSGRSR